MAQKKLETGLDLGGLLRLDTDSGHGSDAPMSGHTNPNQANVSDLFVPPTDEASMAAPTADPAQPSFGERAMASLAFKMAETMHEQAKAMHEEARAKSADAVAKAVKANASKHWALNWKAWSTVGTAAVVVYGLLKLKG